MISMEDFKAMQTAVNEAEKDDTPYLAVVDDEMHVLGDQNKTELKKHSYTLGFAFPNTEANKKFIGEGNIIKETENYLYFKRTFKDVFVPPRRHTAVLNTFVKLEAFFKQFGEDGELVPRTEAEVRAMLESINDEVEDAVYETVGKILGVSSEDMGYALISSVIEVFVKMCRDNPEILNEADIFFA